MLPYRDDLRDFIGSPPSWHLEPEVINSIPKNFTPDQVISERVFVRDGLQSSGNGTLVPPDGILPLEDLNCIKGTLLSENVIGGKLSKVNVHVTYNYKVVAVDKLDLHTNLNMTQTPQKLHKSHKPMVTPQNNSKYYLTELHTLLEFSPLDSLSPSPVCPGGDSPKSLSVHSTEDISDIQPRSIPLGIQDVPDTSKINTTCDNSVPTDAHSHMTFLLKEMENMLDKKFSSFSSIFSLPAYHP